MHLQRLRSLWLIAAALLLALAGCQSTSRYVGQHAVPAASYIADPALGAKAVDGGDLTYQLQAGDQIEVKFYYHPELNELLTIGPDARIALQLIGEVNVSGLSAQQLSEQLARRYAGTLRNPQATVILRKYAAARVYVAGEVMQPTAHIIEGGRLTALQAITLSGGFRKGAERGNVIVLRNSGTGKPSFIKLDLQGHLEQTVLADLQLRPYDIVYVPQRRIAEMAEFFEEYVNKIVPLYRNLGFQFTYSLRNTVQVDQPTPTAPQP